MTPRELCELAARINAAVPGLVPRFERDIDGDPPRYQEYIFVDDDDNTYTEAFAAAMMLGRVVAARRAMSDRLILDMATPSDHELRPILQGFAMELSSYVATTLPGAKG